MGDRCSEIEDGSNPYYNCSKSINDSWYVSFSYSCVYKIVDTQVGEDMKFGRDRDKCSEIEDGSISYPTV